MADAGAARGGEGEIDFGGEADGGGAGAGDGSGGGGERFGLFRGRGFRMGGLRKRSVTNGCLFTLLPFVRVPQKEVNWADDEAQYAELWLVQSWPIYLWG